MTTQPALVRSRIVGVHGDARDFHIAGPLTDLQVLIAVHTAAGTLVHATAPRPAGTPGYAVARLRLRHVTHTSGTPLPFPPGYRPAGQPLASTPGIPVRNRSRIAVIATTIVGAVAGLLTAAAFLLGQLVELITAHAGLILGVLALAAILTGLAARRGSGRRHCPGC